MSINNKPMHFSLRRLISRRTVLRGSGVAMSLPWLSAMRDVHAAPKNESAPRRFVAMTLGLGLVAENLFPEEPGKNYQPSIYLDQLQDMRDQFTVISGVSHPGVTGGHRAEASILTATPMGSGMGRNSISLDQLLAKHFGDKTRFPSLVLATRGSSSPCYTENGSMIPPENSPSQLFNKLFVDESSSQRKRQAERIRQGRSIMDLVGEDAKSLERELGAGDRNRLDSYFTSVRELERRMQMSEQWAKRPKPDVEAKCPVDVTNQNDVVAQQKTMCDVIKLALQTDSSRFITLHVPGTGGVVPVEGVEDGYHSLSHHGKDEEKLAQLALVELAMIRQWGQFIRELCDAEEGDGSLLDHTAVFLTSNLGNASNHDNRNMPVLLAGGGFEHGNHLAFDRKNNYPLPNLYVSVLQRMGLETDQFATSTGTMDGLRMTNA